MAVKFMGSSAKTGATRKVWSPKSKPATSKTRYQGSGKPTQPGKPDQSEPGLIDQIGQWAQGVGQQAGAMMGTIMPGVFNPTGNLGNPYQQPRNSMGAQNYNPPTGPAQGQPRQGAGMNSSQQYYYDMYNNRRAQDAWAARSQAAVTEGLAKNRSWTAAGDRYAAYWQANRARMADTARWNAKADQYYYVPNQMPTQQQAVPVYGDGGGYGWGGGGGGGGGGYDRVPEWYMNLGIWDI